MEQTKSLGFSPPDALFHHRYKFLSRAELVAELETLYTNRDIVQEHIKAANMALEALDVAMGGAGATPAGCGQEGIDDNSEAA